MCVPTGSHSIVGTEYNPLAVGTGTGGVSKTTLKRGWILQTEKVHGPICCGVEVYGHMIKNIVILI